MKKLLALFLFVFMLVIVTSIPTSAYIREDGVCQCEDHIETGYCHCCIYCENLDNTYMLDCCTKLEIDGKVFWTFCCALCSGLEGCECYCSCCEHHYAHDDDYYIYFIPDCTIHVCGTCGAVNPASGHRDENNDNKCEKCDQYINTIMSDDYEYAISNNKAIIVRPITTPRGDIVIPATLGGYPVTAIGDEAFAECYYLTSVTIPETVTEIGEKAFINCVNLSEISLSYSLKTIDNFAFGYCVSLQTITVPDTVNYIGSGAFAGCFLLKEFNVPENVESFSTGTFMYCFSLEKLIVNNVQTNFEAYYICCTDYKLVNIKVDELAEKIKELFALLDSGNTEAADKLYNEITENHFILTENVELIKNVTIYSHDPSTAKTYAEENGIPFKNISELEEPHTCSFGEWFTETEPTVFSEGVLKRICECGEFETKPIAKLESAVTKDETTNVEITYTEENFETEVSVIVSDEEINANIVFGDEFENYKAFDISLVADGEKVQPKGYVTVKFPLPEGFNAETTAVYYIDDDGNKTKLDSSIENGYVIFETNHFSEYVLVDESSKIKPPHEHSYISSVTKNSTCTESGTKAYTCVCGDTYTETIKPTGHNFDGSKCKNCDFDKADNCSCNCHKGGISGFFWKIINFFNKLFKSKQYCACGAKHW